MVVPTGPCLNFPILCSFYFYKISKVRLETNNYIIKTIFKSRDMGDKGSCYFLLRGRSPCLWLTESSLLFSSSGEGTTEERSSGY